MSRVWAECDQSGTPLLVMLALADHADDAGVCWPGIDSIARKARISRATAYRTLAALEGDGELDVEHRRGRGLTNRYTLTGYAAEKTSQAETKRRTVRRKAAPKNVSSAPKNVSPVRPEPSREPTTTAPHGRKPLWDAFCASWDLPPDGGRHKGLAGEFDRDCTAAGATVDEYREFYREKRQAGEWGKYVKIHNCTRDFLAWRKCREPAKPRTRSAFAGADDG